jgi:hypothetical protein
LTSARAPLFAIAVACRTDTFKVHGSKCPVPGWWAPQRSCNLSDSRNPNSCHLGALRWQFRAKGGTKNCVYVLGGGKALSLLTLSARMQKGRHLLAQTSIPKCTIITGNWSECALKPYTCLTFPASKNVYGSVPLKHALHTYGIVSQTLAFSRAVSTGHVQGILANYKSNPLAVGRLIGVYLPDIEFFFPDALLFFLRLFRISVQFQDVEMNGQISRCRSAPAPYCIYRPVR